MNGALSFYGFLFGIGIAVVTFILKDLITYAIEGHRFRVRLVHHVLSVLDGHARDVESVDALHAKISLEREKGEAELSWAFQWDAPPAGMEPILENGAHLTPTARRQAEEFYDALHRADRIRVMYNQAVVAAVSHRGAREGAVKLAATSLKDLRWEYAEILSKGCDLLIELSRTYPLINLDIRECEARRQDYDRKQFFHSGKTS